MALELVAEGLELDEDDGIRRRIVAVESDQENSRSEWRIAGRSRPRTSGGR